MWTDERVSRWRVELCLVVAAEGGEAQLGAGLPRAALRAERPSLVVSGAAAEPRPLFLRAWERKLVLLSCLQERTMCPHRKQAEGSGLGVRYCLQWAKASKRGTEGSCSGEEQSRPTRSMRLLRSAKEGQQAASPLFPKAGLYRPVCTYHLTLPSPSLPCPWLPRALHLLHLPHPPPHP